jgi:broad specificity phosphatase PhoE
MKDWQKIIAGLKSLIATTGPIWPKSTKLAGFASDGPYHCANCEYLNAERNRCNHEVMKADSEVAHDESGLAIISDPERQCCEFVEPVNLIQIQSDQLVALFMRHGQTTANKEKRFRGAMNVPLDDKGRQQAVDARRFLAGYLKDKQLGKAYTSSKDRAIETAELVLPNRAQRVKNFDPLNVGDFSGKPKNAENMKEILHYQAHPDEKIPGGERINDFRERVNPEIKMAIAEGENGKPTISFVHSSTIHQISHFLHHDHNAVKVTPGGFVGVFKRPNGSYYAKALLNESRSEQDKNMMS